MGANVHVNPKDLDRARRLIKAYKLSWPRVLARTAAATTRWIDINFQQEGKLAQMGGWQELADITIMLRRADWRNQQESFFATGKTMGYSGRPSPAAGPGSGKLIPQGNLGPSSFKILQDTGDLKGSVNSRVTPRTARVGFSDIKAGTHQYGRHQFWPFLGKTVYIPARPILPSKIQGMRIFTRQVVAEARAQVRKVGKKSNLKDKGPPLPGTRTR